MRRPAAVLLLFLLLAPLSSSAEEPDPGEPPQPEAGLDDPPEQPGADPAEPRSDPAEPQLDPEPDEAAPPVLPSDPSDRLQMAEAAFRRADYGLLVPLLEPLVAEPSPLNTVEERVQARELLIVGYFFQAQKVTTAADRDALLQQAREVSLALLREKPDHTLDALVFPVSVVDLFEAVRADNADELNALLAERQKKSHNGDGQVVYLERSVTRHPGWVNFLPFGAGQFQNDQLVKGTVFAILQGAGLAVNAVSYWMIIRLRDPDSGKFDPADGGLESDFARAKRWRQALYGGLAGFGATWAVSIIDGWLNHKSDTVRIRTLDAPPPELGPNAAGPEMPGAGDAGLGSVLRLGLSIELRW